MKKVLVAGGGGYIGSRLCQTLLAQKYHVTALSHSRPLNLSQYNDNFENVVGDVADIQLINALSKRNFDTIIYLVSLDHHRSNETPAFVASVNVVPTWSFLDAFSKQGLKHFIYFSTIHVYGAIANGCIDENHHLHCRNAYGLTHYLSENICRYYGDNTPTHCTLLRLSNSYGSPTISNKACWSLVLNDFCKTAFFNKSIKMMSDGTPLRDFIHGDDVCRAVLLTMRTNDSYKNEVYNLSSGETLTIMELATKVKKVFFERYNQHITIETSTQNNLYDNSFYEAIPRYSISNAKIKSIGFMPQINIESGINELFDYLENNYDIKNQ